MTGFPNKREIMLAIFLLLQFTHGAFRRIEQKQKDVIVRCTEQTKKKTLSMQGISN